MRRRVEVDLSLANIGLDLIGQATHFLERRRRGRKGRAATATRSPSTATCSISAIAGWSSSRTAISPRPWRGNSSSRPGRSCCSSIWSARPTRLIAAIAAKAVKEVTYHAGARRRMGDPARRRHRGKPAADGGRARLELALRPGAVRDGRDRDARRQRAASAPTSRLFRADYDRRDRAPCSPRRRSRRRRTSARSSAAAAAIIASISATCWRRCNILPRTYPDATW